MSESLPKYMLLDQNSQQMRDRRIIPETIYTQQGDRAIVTKKKKITNTINMNRKVNKSSSIFNLQYSSKYGLLFIATSDEVIVKTTQQLEQDLITEQHQDNYTLTIKFSGELFLSPDEEIIAICSQSLIQFVKLASLAQTNNIEVPPVSNVNDSNHFLWVDDSNFVGWKFQGNAMLYTIDPNTLTLRLDQRQLPMQFITGASVIHNHFFLISKMAIKIFQPFTIDQPVVKAQIDMTDPDHQSPFFQFSYIIDIFKTNINQPQFTPNDVYALAVVFYDVQDEATDQRYITFAKGDIFRRESLELRGYQNLYSTKTSRELFYDNFEEKTSFSIKRVIASGFICLALQKSQKVYVIDPLQDFQRINIYDIKSKHQLKNEQGKFLQGMALMKNMLQCQRTVPEKAEQVLVNIIKDYNGQFMSLYFKDKETNITVAFPSSVLAIGGEKFYRRYAVNSIDGIQDENSEEIIKRISIIKHSPHILTQEQSKKIAQKSDKVKERQPKKEQVKLQKKQAINQEKKEEVKKEQKKLQIKIEENIQLKEQKRQQEKGQEKQQKKEQKKAEVKKQENTKMQEKKNVFAITALDSAKPPLTAADLFGKTAPKSQTPTSLFVSQPKNEVAGDTKKIEQQKFVITASKQQAKNPFAAFNKNNEASSFFKGNESKPLLSNVPNLFNKQASGPSQTTPTAFSSIFGKDTGKTQSFFTNKNTTTPSNLIGFQSDQKPTQLKPQETKTNTLFNASANSLFTKPQEAKDNPLSLLNIKKEDTNFLAVKKNQQPFPKKQQKKIFNNLFVAPPPSTNINQISKEPSPVSASKSPIKVQPQIKKQSVAPSVAPSKQIKTQIQQKPKQPTDNQVKKHSLLQAISKKVSVFQTWQKATFSQESKDKQPTSFLNIKKLYNRQFKVLSNIKSDFFKQTEQPMTQFYTQSIKKSSTYQKMQKDPSFQQNEESLKQNLGYYEEVSNKMLYYINHLGKKKQNMRASNLSSRNNPQKAANHLTRINQKNQQIISQLQEESERTLEFLRQLNNQRLKDKRKKKEKIKGKVYNFQDDDEGRDEWAPSKIINSTISDVFNKKQIKAVVISLENIKQTPKIKLPQFQTKSKFAQPLPKKVDPQSSKNTSKVPVPSSFVQKIPPKKQQKVQVPIIKNTQPKKEEQKQAISQIYEQSQNASEEQLQLPSTKRQISSIHVSQNLGLKASKQLKPKPQTQVKPIVPQTIEGKKENSPKEKEDSMLFSQTTSMFSSSKNSNTFFGGVSPSLTATDKPKTEQKKPVQVKAANSFFNQNPLKTDQKGTGAFGSIFAPKNTQNNQFPPPKLNEVKTQEKKVTNTNEVQKKQQIKPIIPPANTGNSIFNKKQQSVQDAFKNMGLGQQKNNENKIETSQKQQKNGPNSIFPPPQIDPPKPSPVQQKKQQVPPTDSQIQANKPNILAPSNSTSTLPSNTNPNPNPFPNPNNSANNVFMGTSFGIQPAPQFGGGNNKFLNANLQQPNNNIGGFNPNAAKFAGIPSNNAPKSFASFGGQNKIFQQQPQQNNSTTPFANETSVFNQASNSINSNDASNNQFNNNVNQGFNANNGNFNPNSGNTNGFNQNNTGNNNPFNNGNQFNNGNNNVFANTGGNNPFNKNNAFNNNNTFANNNNNNNGFNNPNANSNFGSNNAFNQPNTFNNQFNQSVPNTNIFGNNNNTNNSNFLANLKTTNITPPPSSVNPALLQMRK